MDRDRERVLLLSATCTHSVSRIKVNYPLNYSVQAATRLFGESNFFMSHTT